MLFNEILRQMDQLVKFPGVTLVNGHILVDNGIESEVHGWGEDVFQYGMHSCRGQGKICMYMHSGTSVIRHRYN